MNATSEKRVAREGTREIKLHEQNIKNRTKENRKKKTDNAVPQSRTGRDVDGPPYL